MGTSRYNSKTITMTKEKLDNFLSDWAALVIQFTTILFALTFCSVGLLSCVKLIYRIFKMLFLNE